MAGLYQEEKNIQEKLLLIILLKIFLNYHSTHLLNIIRTQEMGHSQGDTLLDMFL